MQKGLGEVEKALQMKPDYIDASSTRGCSCASQANLEKDVAKQQALIKEATGLSDKAEDPSEAEGFRRLGRN